MVRGGVQGSGSSLQGGGPGEGKPGKISEPSTATSASTPEEQHRSAKVGSPENDRRRRLRRPHQRPLALDGQRLEPRRQRRLQKPTTGALPALETLTPLVDPTLGSTLSENGRRELLVRAYEKLRPRERVLRDVVGALERAARGLLRKHRWDFETAGRPTPASTPPLPMPQSDDRDADVVVADFRRLLAFAGKQLHERPVVDRAKRLHDEGLSIIPLLPKSKKPAVLEWESAQTERPALQTVTKRLAQLGEHAGLAVICGAVSGVVVVDLDDASAVEWAKANLPETPWRTRTGRAEVGEHWYYRAPASLELPEKMPFKGSVQAGGRYVVAPGSIHPDTGAVYVALGDWGRPREELPRLDARWFVGVDEKRAARERILRS